MNRPLLLALGLLALAACNDDKDDSDTGGDTDGTDTDTTDTTDTDTTDTDTTDTTDTDTTETTTTPTDPTFTNVWGSVLQPVCFQCHGEGSGGLFMPDPATAYDSLVGVESSYSAGDIRVIPGDPDNSYLVRKLEGGPDIVGVKMPKVGSVTAGQIQLVRDWIAAGAMND